MPLHSFDPARLGEVFPPPRPFWWLPVEGRRHAIFHRDRTTPDGEFIGTLCGQRVKRAPATDARWLWPTCEACWAAAARSVG